MTRQQHLPNHLLSVAGLNDLLHVLLLGLLLLVLLYQHHFSRLSGRTLDQDRLLLLRLLLDNNSCWLLLLLYDDRSRLLLRLLLLKHYRLGLRLLDEYPGGGGWRLMTARHDDAPAVAGFEVELTT